jgi:carbonic anhydrase
MGRDAASDAIAELRIGSQRFRDGHADGPRRGAEHRRTAAAGQAPKADVLRRSDVRASPGLLFDQGTGDLLVVRTAGHVLDRGASGSLEHAVEPLRARSCSSLGTAGGGSDGGRPGHGAGCIDWILSAIRPAV